MKELTYTEECRCAAIHAMRVNVKSLAMESKFNRQEVAKTKNHFVKGFLNDHRIHRLRNEARHAQLALAAVRGKPYILIEQKTKHSPDFDKIRTKAKQYVWYHKDRDKINSWIIEAQTSISRQIEVVQSAKKV